MKVTADRLHISGHYLLAVMSNIHLYAGGLSEISPSALLDDGAIDLWLFEGDTMADIIGRVVDLVSGKHVDSDKVRWVSFRELMLESDQPLYVHVDAEPMPYQECCIDIKVIPKHLRLLVPRETPRELFVRHHDHKVKSM
ncbi:MAG: hypothetical protein A2136_05400 [Chloroflexi bacterium RBG_16_54_11]|nr:MAG: hypothetical protein A2136_05400 [Chloroflexi bacterium RBG_16_54_11]